MAIAIRRCGLPRPRAAPGPRPVAGRLQLARVPRIRRAPVPARLFANRRDWAVALVVLWVPIVAFVLIAPSLAAGAGWAWAALAALVALAEIRTALRRSLQRALWTGLEGPARRPAMAGGAPSPAGLAPCARAFGCRRAAVANDRLGGNPLSRQHSAGHRRHAPEPGGVTESDADGARANITSPAPSSTVRFGGPKSALARVPSAKPASAAACQCDRPSIKDVPTLEGRVPLDPVEEGIAWSPRRSVRRSRRSRRRPWTSSTSAASVHQVRWCGGAPTR